MNNNERRLELEQKKQKLAELRLLKQQREAARGGAAAAQQLPNGEPAAAGGGGGRPAMNQRELDELLAGVGIEPIAAGATAARGASPRRNDGVAAAAAMDGLGESNGPHYSGQNGSSSRSSLGPVNIVNAMGRPSTLEMHSLHPISIAPKNAGVAQASYCKTTQTDDERVSVGEFSMGSQELAFDDEMSVEGGDDSGTMVHGRSGGHGVGLNSTSFDESPTHEIRKHLTRLEFRSAAAQHGPGGDHGFNFSGLSGAMMGQSMMLNQHSVHGALQQQPPKVPELSEEEKKQILNSADFNSFFQRHSKVIERALAEDVDIFVDYINGPVVSDADKLLLQGKMLTHTRTFHLERLTEQRAITALDFSHHFPELLAVAYDRCGGDGAPPSATAAGAPEGLVCVWNTRFHNAQPEMVFHNSSRITAMLFDRFQANVLIGGCYSGQLALWDTRSQKKGPVCKTLLSNNAHTQPVLCMRIVGSANAHDLVTLSSDGRMCSWSVDSLQAPIDSVTLVCKSKRQITALCLSFFHSANINSFVVGSEEAVLYVGDRLASSKGELARSFPAHSMPITAVSLHRASGAIDFSSLCLTGSLDFAVRLWNLKEAATMAAEDRPQPLLNLERKHGMGICDVQWSPVHPAVFVSASMDGVLNLWNLNANVETPITTLQVESSLNKVLWSRNGQQLVVAGNSGRVHLYDVHEMLYSPKSSEWDDLANTLAELKISAGEGVGDGSMPSASSASTAAAASSSSLSLGGAAAVIAATTNNTGSMGL